MQVTSIGEPMNFARTIAILALMCFAVAGCDKPTSTSDGHSDHNHSHDGDHDHEHSHGEEGHSHGDAHPAHGPNGGHIFAFDSDYQGEWANYRANDLVRIYILDAAGKEPAPVKGTVVVTRDKDGSEFELDPESPDADGKSSIYALDNTELSIAINLGVTVTLKIDDKTHSATINPSKPHKH